MTTRRITQSARSRGRSSASWPWIALVPLVTTGVLIAGVLAQPLALRGGHSETGLITRCLAVADAANPTVAQRLPGRVPVASLAGASTRRMPDAARLDLCNIVDDVE